VKGMRAEGKEKNASRKTKERCNTIYMRFNTHNSETSRKRKRNQQ
jgi:hypothetical protein